MSTKGLPLTMDSADTAPDSAPEPENTGSARSTVPAKPARRRRWFVRLVIVAAVVCLLLASAAGLLLVNADSPWVRAKVRAQVQASLGIGIDYQTVEFGLSRIALGGLSIDAPAADAKVIEHVVTVGSVELVPNLNALWDRRLQLDRLAIKGVELHAVVDHDGGNSLSRLLAQLPLSDEPSAPLPALSHMLDVLADLPAMRLGRAELDGMSVVLQLRGPSGRTRKISVSGMGVSGRAGVTGGVRDAPLQPIDAELNFTLRGRVTVAADAGFVVPVKTPAAKEVAEYLRRGYDQALSGDVHVVLNGRDGLAIDARLARTGTTNTGTSNTGTDKDTPADVVARVGVRFDKAGHTTRVDVTGELLRTLANVEVHGFAADAPTPNSDGSPGTPVLTVEKLVAGADLAPFAPLLPPAFGRLAVAVCRGKLALFGLRNLAADRIPTLDSFALDTETRDIHYAIADVDLRLAEALAHVTGRPGPDNTVTLTATAPLKGLKINAIAHKASASLDRLTARANVAELRVNLADPLASTVELNAGADIGVLQAAFGPAAATITDAFADVTAALGNRRLNLAARASTTHLHASNLDPVATADLSELSAALTVTELPADVSSGLGASQIAARVSMHKLSATGFDQSVWMDEPAVSVEMAGIAVPPFAKVAAIGSMRADASVYAVHAGSFGTLSDLGATLIARVLKVDPKQPKRATGHVDVQATIGTARVGLKLDRDREPLKWRASAHIPALGKLIGGLRLPADVRKLAQWDRLTIDASTKGTASNLAGKGPVRLEHHEQATVGGLIARFGGFRTSLPLATATIDGQGAGLKHELRLVADVARPTVAGYSGVGKHAFTGHLIADLQRPDVSFEAGMTADAGPKLQGAGSVRFAGENKLKVALSGQAANLGSIAAALPAGLKKAICVDLRRIEGTFALAGDVAVARSKVLDGSALRRWGQGVIPDVTLELSGAGKDLRCRLDNMYAALPSVQAKATLTTRARVIRLLATGTLPALRYEVGALSGELKQLTGEMKVESGALAKASGTTRLRAKGRLLALTQSLVPQYKIGDATFSADITHKQGGDVRIDQLAMNNPLAGTALELSGGVQLPTSAAADTVGAQGVLTRVTGRRSLALIGTATQELAPLAAHDERVTASGKVSVPFRLESGDLTVLRATAKVNLIDVGVGIPALQVAANGISGNIPMREDIEIRDGTVRLLGGGSSNAYARWRFADQQAFIGGDHFVSVQSVTVRGNTFGPIAGNAEVDRNMLHLDQLEMSVLGGKVTGQCIVNIDGRDTEVAFRGSITGVKAPGSDQRLDANTAMTLAPGRLSLVGRAEVLQLGRPHLLGMLELWDPYREDDRANKLRLALIAGYPESMRIRFEHGFADFSVNLGGLGNLVRIDDIRGIPLGPAMSRYVAPWVDKIEALLEGKVQ